MTAQRIVWAALCAALWFMPGCSQQSGAEQPQVETLPPVGVEDLLYAYLNPRALYLRSDVALVVDEREGRVLYGKKTQVRQPIASLTKLMTAMVVIDAGLPMDEVITITKADRDRLRGSKSRLSYGSKLTRRDLLKIALAGSDNRAAAALGRTYPGGKAHIVASMNSKAQRLEMDDSAFRDPAGLHSGNLSTADDLVTLVAAAARYPLIREFTTIKVGAVTDQRSGWKVRFVNTNRLVRSKSWEIGLSKTGYIADAGHCLVMRAEIADRPVTLVLLNSWGTLSKFGDANRIQRWLDRADKKARAAARAVKKAI